MRSSTPLPPTEPPYDPQTRPMLEQALREMHRVLKPGGRCAILCADWQADLLRPLAETLHMQPFLESPINRKGIDVFVFGWRKV